MALQPLEIRVTADTSSAEAGLKRVETQIGKTASRTTAYSKSAQGAAGSTANLAAQFNDIGVMLASGQSPLLLALQQGTQVNQVLGQMGTTGASRVKALGVALLSVISPANLVTLGVIAGGAALIQWAMSSEEAKSQSEQFADTLEGLSNLTDEANRITKILSSTISELSEEYLLASERTRELARFQAELAASQAGRRLADQMQIANEALRQYVQTSNSAFRSGTMLSTAINNLSRDLQISGFEARELSDALKDMRDAPTFEEQRAALERVQALLKEYNVDLSLVPDELSRAIQEMITLIRETDAAAGAMAQLAAAAANVTVGVPLTLARAEEEGGLLPPDTKIKPKRGRSGGGAARRAEAERERNLERFIESLQTEREVLETWRVEQMELLAQFNEQELEAIGGHNEARLRLEEEYQERLREIQSASQQQYLGNLSSLFGNMAQIMSVGGKKTLGIAKAFAIAEGLINSYRAYTQVLADPSLMGRPFLRQALAASTLAAGLAQVANIRSVSTSGGGGAGGGAGASGPGVVNTQRVDLNIIGGTDRDRLVAQEVISVLNNAQRDGFRLDPRLIGG